MIYTQKTEELLLAHCRQYPLLQVVDILKFIHQSAFGCEHLVTDCDSVTDYIRTEAAACKAHNGTPVEALNGDYSRVHLDVIKNGLSAETLGKLFCLSAIPSENGQILADKQLQVLQMLAEDGKLPFSAQEIAQAVAQWRQNGLCACRHSQVFRDRYAPAYRVIKNEYVRLLPLLTKIDKGLQQDRFILAVEGGSASGKTTLAALLQKLYDCTVFHMDDFFLRPEQRTPQRFAEPGGNVDRERFLSEVLLPLHERKTVSYRRFDCSTFTLQPPVKTKPTKLIVIEGAYSCHTELADFYDLRVFMEIDPQLQRQRILKRNGEQLAQRFFNEWIPMEQRYFDKMNVRERCDLILTTE